MRRDRPMRTCLTAPMIFGIAAFLVQSQLMHVLAFGSS